MKQITTKQAESLACADAHTLKQEIQYCQADWIRDNARYIADIETKRTDKTFYGTWPKGWRAAMKADSIVRARLGLTTCFINSECFQLDGAIWLGNFQLINQLEKP